VGKAKEYFAFSFLSGSHIFCFCEMNGKQESNKWAEPYAISTNGSPLYYEEEGGVSVEESEPEMLDDNGVTCSGLDHADSQGLNKITRRLR
jgi:hypothetical protein